VLLALAAFVFTRGLHDRTNYDEGVYLASLDALRHGQELGRDVFASQPPGFYVLLRLIGAFAGRSVESIRLGIVALALVGVGAAYVLGRELAGRWGGLASAALLVAAPPFAANAPRVQADLPSVVLALLALAVAARWFRPKGVAGAVAAGVLAAAAVSVKLLALPVVVPLALLAWQRRIGARAAAACLGGAVVVGGVLALVYAPVLGDLWRDAVSFHNHARSIPTSESAGRRLRDYFGARTPTTYAMVAGAVVALLARRQAALWAWVGASILFLLVQVPLHDHHFVLLAAALTTAAGTSLASAPARLLVPALAAAGIVAAAGVAQQYRQIHRSVEPEPADVRSAAAIVRSMTRKDELVVSDLPVVPYLADRREPGPLVDTSAVRFESGSLHPDAVRRSDARVYVAGREFLRYPAAVAGLSLVRTTGGIRIYRRR
jgi:4-amino-4-deoxy-L-arabinose transferase-like glycosyltransferase